MAKKKEDQFEKLARLIKEEGEDIRVTLGKELHGEIGKLRQEMQTGFTDIKRRLDVTIQPQLDEHARRIKDLEVKTARLSHSRGR